MAFVEGTHRRNKPDRDPLAAKPSHFPAKAKSVMSFVTRSRCIALRAASISLGNARSETRTLLVNPLRRAMREEVISVATMP